MLNTSKIISDFPILTQKIAGKKLVYLDNAATSHKPQQVIDAISEYYQKINSNVHRGVHTLSDKSTRALEESREKIAAFFGADPDELIFCPNTTYAINGVAYGWADYSLHQNDIIITSVQEHHSNLVVWQEVARRTGAIVEFIQINEIGELNLEHLETLFKKYHQRIKLIALTHVSNALGVINPIDKIVKMVSQHFSTSEIPKILIDAAQSAPRIPIEFHKMKVDFLAFSGHKMLGPMGSGGLIVRKTLLETGELHPWFFGGGMIDAVSKTEATYAETITDRFTPGTPDVASAVGLAAACDYLSDLGMENVLLHDRELMEYAWKQLKKLPDVECLGPKPEFNQLKRVGSIIFVYKGVHAHDVAQVLDSEGVAVRSGHHCTMPLHSHFDWQATVRLSFEIYNTREDIDSCILALQKVAKIFGNKN